MNLLASILVCAGVTVHAPPRDATELLVWSIQRLAGEEEARDEAFLNAITQNEAWMREVLDSGTVRDGRRSIAFLESLWRDDPDLENRQIDRSMATACALEIGQRGRDEANMRMIYEYYRNALHEQRLNICYDTLATWERRFLAHGVQHGGYNAIASQEYLLKHIAWPRAAYVNACWRAPYRSYNCFGDSVQGWMYYQPFVGSFENSAEQTLTVGAVCGGLSNVGAAAAIANGIPAFTMGEPGHCAYAVEVAPGRWQPAYSLSWKRGLHTAINRGTWTSHMLAQESFLDPAVVQKANDKRRLARWHVEAGDPKSAERAYRDALRRNALDESLWDEYLTFAATQDRDPSWWMQAGRRIEHGLLPDHPEPAWALLAKHVFPKSFGDSTPNQRASSFGRFNSQLEGWGSSRWNIEGAWNWMYTRIGDEKSQPRFILNVVEHLVDSTTLGPTAVAWAMQKNGDDPKRQDALERTLLSRTRSSSDGRDAILRQMARQGLPAAAEAHDLETFQRIGRAASRLQPARPSLEESNIKPFKGQLLSHGGALRIFKPGNRWDGPENHWGVLEERGGDFHTENGTTPWFEIELPHFGMIEGIVMEGRHGQTHRYNGARILVSVDGQEWEHAATLEGSNIWYRVDLADSRPKARFVRVERDGKCLHFHRVLVYGRKAS